MQFFQSQAPEFFRVLTSEERRIPPATREERRKLRSWLLEQSHPLPQSVKSIKLARKPIIADPLNNRRSRENFIRRGGEQKTASKQRVPIERPTILHRKSWDKRIIRGRSGTRRREKRRGGIAKPRRGGPLRILIKRPWPRGTTSGY